MTTKSIWRETNSPCSPFIEAIVAIGAYSRSLSVYHLMRPPCPSFFLKRYAFADLEGKVKGMKGFVIMDSLKDSQESIVLTLWETKGDMDSFYQPDNKVLANFVESSKILFEEMPERNDYVVSSFKV